MKITKPYVVVTQQGSSRMQQALLEGDQIKFDRIDVGDNYQSDEYLPLSEIKNLRAVRNLKVSLTGVDVRNVEGSITVSAQIPRDSGGYWIAEIGIFEGEDLLIYLAYPKSYRPALTEGFYVIRDVVGAVLSTDTPELYELRIANDGTLVSKEELTIALKTALESYPTKNEMSNAINSQPQMSFNTSIKTKDITLPSNREITKDQDGQTISLTGTPSGTVNVKLSIAGLRAIINSTAVSVNVVSDGSLSATIGSGKTALIVIDPLKGVTKLSDG